MDKCWHSTQQFLQCFYLSTKWKCAWTIELKTFEKYDIIINAYIQNIYPSLLLTTLHMALAGKPGYAFALNLLCLSIMNFLSESSTLLKEQKMASNIHVHVNGSKKWSGCHAGYQAVSRWIWDIHCRQVIKHASEGSILALKHKANNTRSQKQGYQWLHKKDCPEKLYFLKKMTSWNILHVVTCYKLMSFHKNIHWIFDMKQCQLPKAGLLFINRPEER